MARRSAIFLDRDGVLCVEKGYVTDRKELEIFPYAKHCIDVLHQKGYLAICVTNQAAVAYNFLTEKVLQEMNQYLCREIGLDALYYCPHHPEGTGKFGIKCACRKPDTGMIAQAVEDFEIDLENSYIVGDRATDILCGQKAGIRTVLVESGYGSQRLEQPVQPDFIYSNLKEFVESDILFIF